jgi:hypothetical protein
LGDLIGVSLEQGCFLLFEPPNGLRSSFAESQVRR